MWLKRVWKIFWWPSLDQSFFFWWDSNLRRTWASRSGLRRGRSSWASGWRRWASGRGCRRTTGLCRPAGSRRSRGRPGSQALQVLKWAAIAALWLEVRTPTCQPARKLKGGGFESYPVLDLHSFSFFLSYIPSQRTLLVVQLLMMKNIHKNNSLCCLWRNGFWIGFLKSFIAVVVDRARAYLSCVLESLGIFSDRSFLSNYSN